MIRSWSPWDGSPVCGGVPASPTGPALDAMADAWHSEAAHPRRIHPKLATLARILSERTPAIIDLLIREAGKTRADATSEAALLPRKIAITLGPGLERTPLLSGGGADPATSSIRWRPRGPAVVLGPFNFPLHLLHGLVVPALAVGCPVVAKPSERCPALGALYASCLAAADLDDVVRIVHGGRDCAAQLIADPRISTVAAVGSWAMGQAVARVLADRPQVVLALEMGGVNHALLCPDADLDAAAPVLADGAWRMAGQRCTATRIIHVPRIRMSEMVDRLRRLRQQWIATGSPDGNAGPLIDSAQRTAFHQSFAPIPPGLELLAGQAGEAMALGPAFAEPLLLGITDDRAWMAPGVAEERFGPYLVVAPYDHEDAAVARMATNPHRLAAAVWTPDKDRFTTIAEHLPYGIVAWNRNTAGARSDQPFGGCGTAGNGHPAALAAGAIFADETVIG